MIIKGTWVSISRTLLQPEQRTGKLPAETKQVPFRMFVKGTLQMNAEIGGQAEVKTRTGRMESGTLTAVHPQYEINYGGFVEEILQIGDQAKALLFGGDTDEK